MVLLLLLLGIGSGICFIFYTKQNSGIAHWIAYKGQPAAAAAASRRRNNGGHGRGGSYAVRTTIRSTDRVRSANTHRARDRWMLVLVLELLVLMMDRGSTLTLDNNLRLKRLQRTGCSRRRLWRLLCCGATGGSHLHGTVWLTVVGERLMR